MSDASGSPSYSLNNNCAINTYELRNEACGELSSSALEYSANFWQTSGTTNGTSLGFTMNINPSDRLNTMTNYIIHEYTRCIYTENGHGVSNTETFKVRLKCNSNYAVTLPTEMTSQQNFESYLDSNEIADYSYDFSSFAEYTNPADGKCQLSTYDV